MALPDAAYKNIREAIVVVISDGHAHSIHFEFQAGGASNVGERSVAIVAVQTQSRFLPLVARPIHSINQQNVLPPVVVVVQKCATRAQCFGQELSSEGSAIMLKLYSRRAGDIGDAEPQWRGRRAKKIARPERGVKGAAASSSNKLATLHGSP